MKTGKCPKCNSTEIYFKENVISIEGSQIRISPLSHTPVNHYVCVDCGYVENYISHPKKIKRIKNNWVKITGDENQEFFSEF
jgi:predicted nucleic-acid-binding Zn-ribbon protein